MTKSISSAGGGVGLSVAALYRHIQRLGTDVTVFASDKPDASDPGDPRSLAYGSAADLAVRLAFQRRRFDVVHTHGLWQAPSIAVAALSLVARTPHVVSPHGMLDRWALAQSRAKKRAAQLFYEGRHIARARCLHALTEAEARSARDWGFSGPIAIIPNGVDLPDATAALRPQPFAASSRSLLYLGRLHPKKGVDILIDAWADATAAHPARAEGWKLRIAGWDDGCLRPALERKVAARGLSRTVAFVGPVFGESKAREFQNAAAFVLPSYSEGLPVAVLEAWSYGLPVLMTDACNLDTGFARGAAIRIAPERASIAAALTHLMSRTGADLAHTGAVGRALVAEQFAWPLIARRHLSTYAWLVDGGSTPDWMRLV